MTLSAETGRPRRSEAVEALLTAGAGRPGVWTLAYVDATVGPRNAVPGEGAEADREAELTDEAGLSALTGGIYRYAERHQLQLAFTYVDLPGQNHRGFRELLARIELSFPHQVLVPRLDHLASAAIELNGEICRQTKHERLQRLRVPIVEISP